MKIPPLYVRAHPKDNVAIVVNEGGLPAGSRFESGLVLEEAVPEAHKIALTDLASGRCNRAVWRGDRACGAGAGRGLVGPR